ncbi:MAG: hypothetical protein LBB68_07850 [Treponema sp.]|jgi:hypothetical protein|nr:hypothetical protein [Treponema sp.]
MKFYEIDNALKEAEERLEKRFRQAIETLSKYPQKSIYGSSANRAEAKAIYNLFGNDKFNKSEILRAHRAATIRRMEGRPLILAVQDTTSVNYGSRREMEGKRIYQRQDHGG